MKFDAKELAALVRYIVQTEKDKNPEYWRIPAIRALRTIKSDMVLREAKNLVESVDPPWDPVVKAINDNFGVF